LFFVGLLARCGFIGYWLNLREPVLGMEIIGRELGAVYINRTNDAVCLLQILPNATGL
jgi:hypothetical protein